jgi:hypothetical protein
VPVDDVFEGVDISLKNGDKTYLFTDGCGTMSIALRNNVSNICFEFFKLDFKQNYISDENFRIKTS